MPDREHDNVRAMWSDDELDGALAALDPAAEADDQVFHRARSELLLAAGAREPLPEPARRPSRRWAWWAASAGIVAAVVASVLVVQTVQFSDTIPDAAADQLNLAADRVDAVDGFDEPLQPGQYRYIATHAWWMATMNRNSYLAENLLETWVPADQSQDWLLRRDVTGKRKWVAGSEEKARAEGFPIAEPGWPEGEWQAPCGDFFEVEAGDEPCRQKGGWQDPTEKFLAALPRDAGELYVRLRRETKDHGGDADQEMLVYVADVLRTGLVPSDLRAALYRTLAKVDGLQITEQVANLDGRRGIAYGVSANGRRHDVIVDPATGQFIGERQLAEHSYDDIPAGTITEYTSVATAVVPGMGSKPTG
jgi:hypothetical protein